MYYFCQDRQNGTEYSLEIHQKKKKKTRKLNKFHPVLVRTNFLFVQPWHNLYLQRIVKGVPGTLVMGK